MARGLVGVVLLSFIPYFVAVWRAARLDWQQARWWIVGVALLLRAGVLVLPVTLSDDVYRYWWEGCVQRAGFNPYRLAPAAGELAGLRDANWALVAHRAVPSAYPPGLLLVFRAATATGAGPWIFRLLFAACDLATFWLLVQLLRARGQNETWALIWALNPLVVLEFAGSGHEMSLAISLFMAGLWALEKRRGEYAALAFAGATLAHLLALPLALTALLTARVKSPRAWLCFVSLWLAGFAIFADAGRDFGLGLFHFAARWRFNGSLFEILAWLFDDVPRQGLGGVWLTDRRAKIIAAGALVAVAGWVWHRRYDVPRAVLAVAGTLLLLAPTVHPWYVTWLVALVCLEFRLSWLMFSALVPLSYVARIVQVQTGVWVDTLFVRWLEYAPLFALLAADLWRKRFDRACRAQ